MTSSNLSCFFWHLAVFYPPHLKRCIIWNNSFVPENLSIFCQSTLFTLLPLNFMTRAGWAFIWLVLSRMPFSLGSRINSVHSLFFWSFYVFCRFIWQSNFCHGKLGICFFTSTTLNWIWAFFFFKNRISFQENKSFRSSFKESCSLYCLFLTVFEKLSCYQNKLKVYLFNLLRKLSFFLRSVVYNQGID